MVCFFCCSLNTTLNTSTLTLYNFFFCISLLLIMNYWPLKNGGLLEVRRHQRVLYSIAYKYDLCFTFLFIYIIFNTSILSCSIGYHIARKKTNFLCYQYSASSAVVNSTFSLMHINIIIQSQREIHACNQMKWLIKTNISATYQDVAILRKILKRILSSTS